MSLNEVVHKPALEPSHIVNIEASCCKDLSIWWGQLYGSLAGILYRIKPCLIQHFSYV